MIPHCGLICTVLITNKFEHLFIGHCVASLVKRLFMACLLPGGYIFSSFVEILSILDTLDTNCGLYVYMIYYCEKKRKI